MTDPPSDGLDVPRALQAALMMRTAAEMSAEMNRAPDYAGAILTVYGEDAPAGPSGTAVLGRIVAEQATALAFTLDLWATAVGGSASAIAEQIAARWRSLDEQ